MSWCFIGIVLGHIGSGGVSARVLSQIGLIPASLHFYFLRPEEVQEMFSSIFLLTFGSAFCSRPSPLDFYMEHIRPSSRDRGSSVGFVALKHIGLKN